MKDDPQKISDLFMRLVDDPDLVEQYKLDPETVLKNAGVSKPAIEAIVTCDLAKIGTIFSKAMPILYIIVTLLVPDLPDTKK